MAARGVKSLPTLGFLTVIEHESHGLFGGYLILNISGRPVEFHCTAPVKANRAQEILFGPTLGPYLYGEQIGQALLNKASVEPLAVLTDQPPALATRDYCNIPMGLVTRAEAGGKLRVDTPHAGVRPAAMFTLGCNQLSVATQHAGDQTLLKEHLTAIADHFDLSEPFGRIREAIDEAQRGSR